MKNKKGVMLGLRTLELLIIIAVFSFMAFKVYSYATNPYISSSIFLSKDSAKLIDSLQAIPTDANIEYPISTNGKFLTITESSTKVIEDKDESNGDYSVQLGHFNPSSFYEVKPSANVDTALFALKKRGSEIEFISGAEAKMELPEEKIKSLDTSSLKNKSESPMYLYVITDKTQKLKMEYFRKALEDNLLENGIPVVVEQNKSKIVIEIETLPVEKTQIYYSQQNSYETKRLAENVLKILPEDLDPLPILQISLESLDQGEIRIQFGLKAQEFLEKDSNKRYIARFVAIALASYYGK